MPTTNSINFIYKWNIEKYSRLYDEGHQWKWAICSDYFSPPNNDKFEFAFQLHPKGYSENWKDFVSISFGVHGIPQIYEGKIRCHWNVSIVDENGERCGPMAMPNYSIFCLQENVLPNYMKHSSLLDCSCIYLPHDNLTLHFEINLESDERIFNVIKNNSVKSGKSNCAANITHVAHKWTVDNFARLFDSNEVTPSFIRSGNFPSINEQSEQFYLRLYPNACNGKNKDCLDIGIRNDNENGVTVHHKMSILDVNGEKCYIEDETLKIKPKNGKCYEITRAYFLHNGLFEYNKLRIYFEMSYIMDSIEGNETPNCTQMLDTVHKSESLFDVNQKTFHFVEHKWYIDKFNALCLNSPEKTKINSQIFSLQNDT